MISIKDKQLTLYSRLKQLKDKATVSELSFKARLDKTGIKYIFQKGFIAGDGYYIVDFYLPKPYKICIEIDGGYHSTQQQIDYDTRKDRYLSNRGFKVIRILNENVELFELETLNSLI